MTTNDENAAARVMAEKGTKAGFNISYSKLVDARDNVLKTERELAALRTTQVEGMDAASLVRLEVHHALKEARLNAEVKAYAARLGAFVDTYGDAAMSVLFNAEPTREQDGD